MDGPAIADGEGIHDAEKAALALGTGRLAAPPSKADDGHGDDSRAPVSVTGRGGRGDLGTGRRGERRTEKNCKKMRPRFGPCAMTSLSKVPFPKFREIGTPPVKRSHQVKELCSLSFPASFGVPAGIACQADSRVASGAQWFIPSSHARSVGSNIPFCTKWGSWVLGYGPAGAPSFKT